MSVHITSEEIPFQLPPGLTATRDAQADVVRWSSSEIRISDACVECYVWAFGKLRCLRRIERPQLISLAYLPWDPGRNGARLLFEIDSLLGRYAFAAWMFDPTRRALYELLKFLFTRRGWQIVFVDPPGPSAPWQFRFTIRHLLWLTALVAVVASCFAQFGLERGLTPTGVFLGTLAVWKTVRDPRDNSPWGVAAAVCFLAALTALIAWL